jgi:acyl-CoA thioesterase FadM
MQVKPGRFLAGWADMDWNKHMANTAYLNKVVDARMLAFKDMGFSVERFLEMRIGFVVMKDEIDYRREAIGWTRSRLRSKSRDLRRTTAGSK